VDRIWEKFLTDRDRAVLTASGYGSHGGFGKKPALLVIDVSYGFTGDKPEPILDSIKQWRNSCGAESWTAIAVIKDLADLFGVRAVHRAAPAALTCSGMFSARAGTATFGLPFASFMSLHTDAREMRCLLATCVSDMPERRS